MPKTLKSKGPVRVKSGCHTCRIRRKKCDEQRDSEGSCTTCIRLHIQCLGFGGRRPPWLQDRRNVKRTCDKIKAFLATQGLIKGHSACGRRVAVDDALFLRLDDDTTPSSSESPSTLESSLPPMLHFSPPHHDTALDERDEDYGQQWTDPYETSPLVFFPGRPSQDSSQNEIYCNSFSIENQSLTLSSGELQRHSLPCPFPIPPTPSDSFHYNGRWSQYPFNASPAPPLSDFGHDPLTYYLRHVMGLQYVFADRHYIQAILGPAVQVEGFARKAALLLAAIHKQRATRHIPGDRALKSGDIRGQYLKLRKSLLSSSVDRQLALVANKDRALATISVISSVLFDGGQDDWGEWLDLVYSYAKANVFRSDFDARTALLGAGDPGLFIVKNGIWFDVLGSVTTGESPRFLKYIRELYSPTRSRVQSMDLLPDHDSCDRLSMLTTMGAEDLTVLALAEAINLYEWKTRQIEQGSLDAKELVDKATLIEQYLNASVSLTLQNSETHALGAQLFLGATRVYLRSVVSGDFPGVRSIQAAIQETMSTARQLYHRTPNSATQPSSVIRSTVFAFFICGALSDDPNIQREVEDALSLPGENPNNANVGNSPSIRRLLQVIWNKRGTSRGPVQWRQCLKSFNLLLV